MALTIYEVTAAIRSGTRNAIKKYYEWSGLTLQDSGAEGLLVAEIAAALHRKQSGHGCLELEVGYNDLVRRSGARRRRTDRHATVLTAGSRADIALFNANDELKYIIEVKRSLPWAKSLTDDLQRLVEAIATCGKPHGTLARCFFAAYIPATDLVIQNNKERVNDFFDTVDTATGSFRYHVWGDPPQGSICVEIQRRKR